MELSMTDAIVGMQDMGAAGIICSTSEMSSSGGCGMKINLDKIPTRQKNMKPFEILFFDVGAEILKNISGYLAASPDKAIQKIRKDVVRAIKTVQKSKDIKKINTLKAQVEKLEKIGGLSSIVPSEGIVFKYKGKTYKFTGAFAPVNQIVGLLNF